ncbi:Lrp/AsnC family transcriptional regulator [Candidatus Woesearchaeota archaeon]|nr:Lrp/AsnC family transcriptional regulator [Candidatus Woesearchaeota archaeon]
MDNKDAKILDILRSDARLPIREISKQAKMRPSTVHQRIQRLVENKVIEKFTIKLDNKKAGENFIVFMLVKGSTSDYIDAKFLGNRHIREVFGVTGEYDVLIKLKFANVDEFNDFVLNFRKGKNEIQATLTMVATANLKEEI